MKILICGDRNWKDKDREFIASVLQNFPQDTTVIHGACRGVDRLGASAAQDLGFAVEVFPANWNEYGRAAGPIRNRQMLDEKPDLVLAFHDNIEESRGTKDCTTEARRRGITVHVISRPCSEERW